MSNQWNDDNPEEFDPAHESDDLSDDPENPDESDMDHHDDPGRVPCPYCGKLISEETEICHLCGSYLSREDSRRKIPIWILVAVILLVIALTCEAMFRI